jgi:anthranilate phosphoribosyltransferase
MKEKLKDIMRDRNWYLGLTTKKGRPIGRQHAYTIKKSLLDGKMSDAKMVSLLMQLGKIKIDTIL